MCLRSLNASRLAYESVSMNQIFFMNLDGNIVTSVLLIVSKFHENRFSDDVSMTFFLQRDRNLQLWGLNGRPELQCL